jgi:ABC-type histidine transport system ATPase subunit
MTELLQIENLTVAYGQVLALKGVTLTVGAGEAVALVGATAPASPSSASCGREAAGCRFSDAT